ncbi:MAG: chemotaxis protein CheA, partial [Desulfovibrionaceae bacterium]
EEDRESVLRAVDALRTGMADLAETGLGKVPDAEGLVTALSAISKTKEQRRAPARPAARAEGEEGAAKKTERRDIRVDLDKLDVLMNLVGELVIGETMVTRHPGVVNLQIESFERAAHNLRRIIADLQDVAMSVRMVPVSRTFRRMIRLVHDLSKKAGKRVKLELVGEETEVDKTVIEQIADPLVHLVRNSVDHGVEPVSERLAAGKPETATVTIEAGHEGGEVVIRVSDDGRGISREKVLDKARRNGLVQGDGKHLPDGEVFKFIFEPGFSTAEKITDVSGRGVGMDVVKRNLEKIKGRVDVFSTAGQGTTMLLRIPLTLAIIDGMLVRVGDSRYTIPLLSIRESFRPVPEQVTRTMDGQELVRVRELLIPVLRLHEFYGIRADVEDLCSGILICVGSGDRQVCLFADEIIGHHQTVIKAMPGVTGKARGISGCTILGDGEVSLIIDVVSLMDAAEHASAMNQETLEGTR